MPLEIVPPSARPNQLRTAYFGVLTKEQCQKNMGDNVEVLEVKPATCVDEDGSLVPGTEVIFKILDDGGDDGAACSSQLLNCPETPDIDNAE